MTITKNNGGKIARESSKMRGWVHIIIIVIKRMYIIITEESFEWFSLKIAFDIETGNRILFSTEKLPLFDIFSTSACLHVHTCIAAFVNKILAKYTTYFIYPVNHCEIFIFIRPYTDFRCQVIHLALLWLLRDQRLLHSLGITHAYIQDDAPMSTRPSPNSNMTDLSSHKGKIVGFLSWLDNQFDFILTHNYTFVSALLGTKS